MKIPAIKSSIGDWTYYVTTLTFEQVAEYVSQIDNQLHKSESLKDLIQRSISQNYLSIKEYILNQPEVFFNSLVLAVYDNYPDWKAIEFKFDDGEVIYDMGILEFQGTHKIFPVDGQHRVEGIKAAIIEKPELKTQKIGAIFIGHSNSEPGMQRSRRLFTTLNRYAKPVTMDDIIALDEDDSVAIVTRYLLESFELFSDKRITKSANKAIADTDKSSITSIITLYQCNKELLKRHRVIRKNETPDAKRDSLTMEQFLKFRPKEQEIESFSEYVQEFWLSFGEHITHVNTYLQSEDIRPALPYRNKENGGSFLFRPVGLLPFVQAVVEINRKTGSSYEDIFKKTNGMEFSISEIPWKNILWNPLDKSMIMGTSGLAKSLIHYVYNENTMSITELKKLKKRYADKINYENADDITLENVLSNIKLLK